MGKGKDFWLDDPEWEMLRRKAENRPIPKQLKQKAAAQRPQAKIRREEPRARAQREDTDKEVVVNLKLSIPKVKLPDFRQFAHKHKGRLIRAGVAATVLIVVFAGFKVFQSVSGPTEDEQSKTPLGQAEFKPLVPLEGLVDANGEKVAKPEFKYDPEKNVLGYVTTYNGAQLTTSQQQLPEQLKIHPGQLEGIARSVNANVPVETQKGRAYIATDDKTKSQVAVFATKEILVFVRANKTLDNDEWKNYINQLNTTE